MTFVLYKLLCTSQNKFYHKGKMMQAIRQVVAREHIGSLEIPEDFGDVVEIIILPFRKQEKGAVAESTLISAGLQQQTGFAQTVLADDQEDIWNDI